MAKKGAKKKSARKQTAKRKSATRTPTRRDFFFGCNGKKCKPGGRIDIGEIGDYVVLRAVGSDVSIYFYNPPRSPFASGRNPIQIKAGDSWPDEVIGPYDEYVYEQHCSGHVCKTRDQDPSMIVP